MAQGRSLYREIFRNFINSLKPTNIWGEFRGKDQFGTEYYEILPKGGKSKVSRYFVPAEKNKFDQEIPPEWDSWLKKKRKDPPTQEEIQLNLLKMKQTTENAKKLEGNKPVPKEEIKTFDKPPFPVYEEYNTKPSFDKKKV